MQLGRPVRVGGSAGFRHVLSESAHWSLGPVGLLWSATYKVCSYMPETAGDSTGCLSVHSHAGVCLSQKQLGSYAVTRLPRDQSSQKIEDVQTCETHFG